MLQCDDLCVVFRGDESTDVYCRDQAYSEPTPIHSITLYRVQRCAEIRLWSEYIVEGDRVLATFETAPPITHRIPRYMPGDAFCIPKTTRWASGSKEAAADEGK